MKSTVNKIVILGGGTSGWMAAAILAKSISRAHITLVESEQIGTIGVGESTIPSIHFFNDLLGIRSTEFAKLTAGSFKLGIQFENWKLPGEKYFHGFGSTGAGMWAAGFHEYWKRGVELGISKPFGTYNLEGMAAKAGKFAHVQGGLNFAYHLDAALYAKRLKAEAQRHGVIRKEGKVSQVHTHEDNDFISHLELENGTRVDGDFFIDCSGFRGLLINETLKTPFVDWSHWLPMNRAIPLQTSITAPPPPFTRSIAHHAGWQWRIPLQQRMGNGIVYCNQYMSDDEALNKLQSDVEGEVLTEPRVIKFVTGHREKLWNKNCVALGLAGGFIEPLESTALHLVQQGIMQLIKYFPAYGVNDLEVAQYNDYMTTDYQDIRDFIVLHYCQTQREDSPFWRYCREMPLPDSLQNRIALFAQTGRFVQRKDEIFSDSWLQVMIGQGLIPQRHHPLADELSEDALAEFLESIETDIRKKVNTLPSHQAYLQQYCQSES
ncbi:tryptophan halogenase family protein [Aestuariibacter sp. A3R04]|uniref:tryptophan halogenase family protein n=1 Tax=Aestuariibacter sp. A3R04 TaxID=2841571 RepID=UPI0020917AF5|nr:tryptophan halogenase family protein [Aestuariibacter sp. A3R04]